MFGLWDWRYGLESEPYWWGRCVFEGDPALDDCRTWRFDRWYARLITGAWNPGRSIRRDA